MEDNKKEEDILVDEDVMEDSDEENSLVEEAEDNLASDFAVLEKLKDENTKLKNDYLRAYADLENSKKRFQQEIEKNAKYAISSFAKELLSVADNLHRALEASENTSESACEQLRLGVELTETDLVKVFAKFGITKMDILGKVFDPSFHQVVQEVDDNSKPAGTIIAELQTGYMINDRILREAMVVVTK